MDVEASPVEESTPAQIDVPHEIIEYLITNEETFFKSQQINEPELTIIEKREIAINIFLKSKAMFLHRFGKNIKESHLDYFKAYETDADEGFEIGCYLANLKSNTHNKRYKNIRNRRYGALKKLTEERSSYFSETEMMKRNPLLYDQLVGQYLSEDERKTRDNIDTQNITLVNLLLESIDRDTIRKKYKQQLVDETEVVEVDSSESEDEKQEKLVKAINDVNMSDDDEEEIPRTFRWGEFEENPEPATRRFNFIPNSFQDPNVMKAKPMVIITVAERKQLKEKFKSIMYLNFIDGKDDEFDYTTVDNNDDYDNLDIQTMDAEDSYFDSESPADAKMTESDTSEGDE